MAAAALVRSRLSRSETSRISPATIARNRPYDTKPSIAVRPHPLDRYRIGSASAAMRTEAGRGRWLSSRFREHCRQRGTLSGDYRQITARGSADLTTSIPGAEPRGQPSGQPHSLPQSLPSRNRRIERPTVQDQVMSHDEPDLRGTQERAGIAELRRIADPPRR